MVVQKLVKKEDLCLNLWEDQREDNLSRIVVDDSLERKQSKHLTRKKKQNKGPKDLGFWQCSTQFQKSGSQPLLHVGATGVALEQNQPQAPF